MASKNSPTKASKTGNAWDSPALLVELSVAFYHALELSGGLNPAIRDAVPKYMSQNGHNVTWSAIRQHIQKLRKNRDTSSIDNASSGGSPTKSATSAKNTPRKAAGKGAKRKSEAMATDSDEADDSDFKVFLKNEESEPIEGENTPRKRSKRSVKSATPKAHEDDDYDPSAEV